MSVYASYPPSILTKRMSLDLTTNILGTLAFTGMPADLAALKLAVPSGGASAFNPGEFVGPLSDGSLASWSGTAWVVGAATAANPLDLSATNALAAAAANFAGLTGIAAVPTTGWTTGQFVVIGDGSKASWDGAKWVATTAADEPDTPTTAWTKAEIIAWLAADGLEDDLSGMTKADLLDLVATELKNG